MLKDFLFELGTEELPSGAVWPLADTLAKNFISLFAKAKLQHGDVRCFATPRRLAVLIYDVQTVQSEQQITRRGPAYSAGMDSAGQPLPALLGFAKSCGVPVTDLTTIKTEKGEWWGYEATVPGVNTQDLLPEMVREALATLPIAKPMRWGNCDEIFARPVHWAVLLFGDELITTSILGVTTGRQSFGHRFHHPEGIDISSPRTYESSLKTGFVIADFAARRQMVIEQAHQLAEKIDAQVVMPEELIDEVTSIVEWPQAHLVNFPPEFLEVPAEALIAAMQLHQKCFAIKDQQEQLLPHFITIANIVSHDIQRVTKGNEKVMCARLSDASFFYKQDKKKPLEQYYEQTANVIYQIRLGSLQDKMVRLQAFMAYLASPLALQTEHATRAAFLSKCDLMSGMVGEFPELQGLMGYYYARHDGEHDTVAQALNEQYMPRFAADELPQSALGLALSLADRLDTLVGSFSQDLKPSGDKDPFKLRRHALAVVRLLISLPNPLMLSELIQVSSGIYGDGLPSHEAKIKELKPFILERLQSFYQSQGIANEIVQAVRVLQDDWLFDIDKRIKALLSFVSMPQAARLSAACKRVNNLLQHVQTSLTELNVDSGLLVEEAEISLFERLMEVEQQVAPLYRSGDYVGILTALSQLAESVDMFFDQVMVMVEQQAIKNNRLGLLVRLQQLLKGVADISLL